MNSLIGNYTGCYTGHATDHEIRYNSSSGGIATQLLVFALEKGLIDGALVIRMRKDNPLEPEAFVARTKEEIISASRSKYCPVAANTGLKQILKDNGRYAVVGLPCHIHGIRKAESVFKVLKDRIVIHIGLLCSHMVNFDGTLFLLERKGVKKEMVSKIDYRGKGWPGSMSVHAKNGAYFEIPLMRSWNAYWQVFSSFFFTPIRCTMCPDQAGELADISLGDAWLPELKGDKCGRSIIITRTKIGEEILDLAAEAQAISIKPVHSSKVVQSQRVNLSFKKHDLRFRLSLLRFFGRKIPIFNPEPSSKGMMSAIVRVFYVYLNIYASSNKYLKSLLGRFPFPLFRLYYGIYKYLSLI
jgi:coenzyme F420 hydrogenase subunit beta